MAQEFLERVCKERDCMILDGELGWVDELQQVVLDCSY